ncbi:MAG: aldolase/citrate lyase family protein [Ardenticatenaceae bacterium]|nr:aldolase/citrate lyase family protein [Ardenticatenaceae bacterium]
MLMRKSRTKEKLRNGEIVFGTFTLVLEPSFPELVGAAGYDFIGIDMEHTAADGPVIENMIRASQAADITPLVRVRHVEEKTILWVLDSGAEGIFIPMLEDAETARRAYQLTRYPPSGERTLCSATRAAGRGAYRRNFAPFVQTVNEEMLILGLIETPQAAENIRAIAREPVDIFLVGRADLSMKMGFHYAPWHPDVVEATRRVLGTVMEEGKTAGVLAYDLEDAERWMDFGCRLVIYSQPEILLATIYADALAAMKQHSAQLAPPAAAGLNAG